MSYAIFPSLTRGISWHSSQKIEDGTIRDKMEMGYVMTRQRYSRLRRTWKVEYPYLNAVDMAAIDYFYRATVQGGALPFFWKNLLPNGGFETNTIGPKAGTVTKSVLCDGWYVSVNSGVNAMLAAGSAQSGVNCLQLNGIESFSLGANATASTRILSNPVACRPGQTIQVSGSLNVPVGSMPSGASFEARIGLYFANVLGATLQELYPPDTTTTTLQYGWTLVSTSGVAPANTTGVVAECCVFLVNNTGAAIAMPGTPYLTVLFDNIGLALSSPAPTYGNMPSLGSVPVPVRFPKPLEISDLGWVGNGPAYRCQFEMEEI